MDGEGSVPERRHRGTSPVTALVVLVTITAAIAASCSSSSTDNRAAPTGSSPGPTATTAGRRNPRPPSSSVATGKTAWLCRPGLADNPCNNDLTATVIDPTGAQTVERAEAATDPPIDCFYVYPTVSPQTTPNANLNIDPELRAVAAQQTSRFNQVCRVFAPVYPQLTIASIASPSAASEESFKIAYQGVADAWHD